MLTCVGGWEVPMAMGVKRCLVDAKWRYRWSWSTVTPRKFSYSGKKCRHFLTGPWPHHLTTAQGLWRTLQAEDKYSYRFKLVIPGQRVLRKKARRLRAYSTVGSSLKGLHLVSERRYFSPCYVRHQPQCFSLQVHGRNSPAMGVWTVHMSVQLWQPNPLERQDFR